MYKLYHFRDSLEKMAALFWTIYCFFKDKKKSDLGYKTLQLSSCLILLRCSASCLFPPARSWSLSPLSERMEVFLWPYGRRNQVTVVCGLRGRWWSDRTPFQMKLNHGTRSLLFASKCTGNLMPLSSSPPARQQSLNCFWRELDGIHIKFSQPTKIDMLCANTNQLSSSCFDERRLPWSISWRHFVMIFSVLVKPIGDEKVLIANQHFLRHSESMKQSFLSWSRMIGEQNHLCSSHSKL